MTKYRDRNTKPVWKAKQHAIFFFRLRIACHNAHILKIYNRQEFENAVRWYFCQAHLMLFVLNPPKNFVNQNKGKITLIILPWGIVSLAMS